jgi:hypothetical protein
VSMAAARAGSGDLTAIELTRCIRIPSSVCLCAADGQSLPPGRECALKVDGRVGARTQFPHAQSSDAALGIFVTREIDRRGRSGAVISVRSVARTR